MAAGFQRRECQAQSTRYRGATNCLNEEDKSALTCEIRTDFEGMEMPLSIWNHVRRIYHLLTSTMEHNLEKLQQNLLENDKYGASPAIIASVRWNIKKLPHVLLNKLDGNVRKMVPIAVVGRVAEDHLKCGPSGNFIKPDIVKFKSSKYQLLLGKLTGTPFKDDFEEAMQNMRKIQAMNHATDD